MSADCPVLDSSKFSLGSRNGSEVNVTCKDFGHRVVGSRSLSCNTSTQSWEPGVPKCEWTWEFTTHEKVVLGTALGCALFIVVVAVITLIVCCYRRHRRLQEQKEYNDADNPGYSSAPGDTGGAYPDAYFAYQDAGHKNAINGMTGTMDRAWLGYIPRPKVVEGRYYQ